MFLNLSGKEIDCDVLESIQKSLLLSDDRLVIRATFLTTDSSIYGAGPLTRFSHWYHSDEWSHANFNSKEVGQDLAETLLSKLDAIVENLEEESPVEGRLIPIYKQAKIQGQTSNVYWCSSSKNILTHEVAYSEFFSRVFI